MPFKDTDEGQTHYYGDGCTEHPAKMNLREVIEDQLEILNPMAKDYESHYEFGKLVAEKILDALIEEMDKIYDQYGQSTESRSICDLYQVLEQAREDITSLQ